MALFFICDFSSWHITTSPVGIWVMRTAESVVFTHCPPGPEERYTSIFKSSGLICISVSSASGSTATVTADVWIRPPDSVSGMRCTRWTPLSNFIFSYTFLPETEKTISLKPPRPLSWEDMISIFHFLNSAYFEYMRKRSAANRAASSPPVPALISMIMFLRSKGSFGISSVRSSFIWFSFCSSSCLISSLAISLSSGSLSLPAISLASSS